MAEDYKTKPEGVAVVPTVESVKDSVDATTGSGVVIDFISGRPVKATPEEVEAVQVFAARLVRDFGYPKEVITTRPQYRVRERPSGTAAKGYPIDIAVFADAKKRDDDAFILVECKRKTRKDGEKQLRIYLTMSAAQIGVWFNGKDHVYLLKRYKPDGTIEWVSLPSIPRYGQAVTDIGLLTRGELKPPTNLKAVFRDIRNHLAGNTTGITRDQALAQEIMAILFCKIVDELNTAPKDLPQFRAGMDEAPSKVAERIRKLFAGVRSMYSDVFRAEDTISLDEESLTYVVGELQNYAVTESTRDAIGDAFEVFIGPAVRGEEGQFFTPRNVVQLMVQVINPRPGETVIDPACGSGGFLVVALEHVWKQLEDEGKSKGWSDTVIERRRRETASKCFRGIDKDSFLTKVTKAYMAIIGDGRGGIFCEDGLDEPTHWRADAQSTVKLGTFDIVITNPPFGSKIKVKGAHKLGQYDFARKWKPPGKANADWELKGELLTEQSPQVLFIERCIQLLKPGGRLGIVLPESIFGMPVYGFVVKHLYEKYRLRGFVSLPEEIFQPSTHAKTCIVFLENAPPTEDDRIEMAIADWCGHDSRGNPTVRLNAKGEEQLLDDLPAIADQLARRIGW